MRHDKSFQISYKRWSKNLLAKSSKQAIPSLFQMVVQIFKALNAEKQKYLSVKIGCINKYIDSYLISYYKSQRKCFRNVKFKKKSRNIIRPVFSFVYSIL